MSGSDNAIVAKNVYKSFGKLEVLGGIDLSVKRGSILALLGPNGAGKTTMVRILSTLLRADSGTIEIEGNDVVKDADKVRSLIGLTGQYAAVDEYLTGRENLRMIGRLYHMNKREVTRRTEELIKQFDLVEAADRYAKTYSGGMRRRLDLAASLIATPPIIFLDEPTTGLDPRSRLGMWEIIETLAGKGTTIMLTTQHLEEADRLADNIIVIDDGKIIASGSADQLKSKVGKDRLHFTFENETDLDKAAKLLRSKTLELDKRQNKLSIGNDGGVSKLRSTLEKIEQANIRVSAMSLSKPTLDDVFMKLTGHKASRAASNAKTGSKKGKKS